MVISVTSVRVAEILAGVAEGSPAASRLPDLLVRACAQALPVTGVGMVLMTDAGPAGSVAASDGPAATMEELQYTLGEGPCVDSSRTGRPVLEESTHGPSPRVYWSSSIVAAGPSLAATEPAGPASVISTIPTPVTGSACAHARTNRSGRRDAAGEPSATPARISATRTEVTLITIPHRATSTRRAIMSGPWLPNSHHRRESTPAPTAVDPSLAPPVVDAPRQSLPDPRT